MQVKYYSACCLENASLLPCPRVKRISFSLEGERVLLSYPHFCVSFVKRHCQGPVSSFSLVHVTDINDIKLSGLERNDTRGKCIVVRRSRWLNHGREEAQVKWQRRTNGRQGRDGRTFSRNHRISCFRATIWQLFSLALRRLIAILSILDSRLPPLAILSDLSVDKFCNFYLIALPATRKPFDLVRRYFLSSLQSFRYPIDFLNSEVVLLVNVHNIWLEITSP